MITIEELIIQSLYHKLVLVNVKRTQTTTPTGGKIDALGLLISGSSRMRAAMEAQGQLPPVLTNKYSALAAASEAGTSVDSAGSQSEEGKSQTKKHPLVKVASKDKTSLELSQEAETILDTGEIKLVKSMLQGSADDSSESAPLYYFGFDPTSGIPPSIPLPCPGASENKAINEGEEAQDKIVPRHDTTVNKFHEKNIPAVNLSQFDQFSILHFQDKRDPQHNVVMIETPESKKLCKPTEVCTEQLSLSSGIPNGNDKRSLPDDESAQRKSIQMQSSEEKKSFEDVLSSALARASSTENPLEEGAIVVQQSDSTFATPVKKRFERQGTPILDDNENFPSGASSQSGAVDEGGTSYEMDSGIFDMTQSRDSRSGNNQEGTPSHHAIAKVNGEVMGPQHSTPILEDSKKPSVIGDRPTFSYRVFQIQEGVSFEDEQTEEERLQQIDDDEALTEFLNDDGACALETFEETEREVAVTKENIEPVATEVAMITGTLENEDDEDNVTGIVKNIRRSANIPDDLVFNEKNTSMEDSIVQLEHEIKRRDLPSPGSNAPLKLKHNKQHQQKTYNPRARHQGLNLLSDAKDPIPAPAVLSKYSSSLPTAAEVQITSDPGWDVSPTADSMTSAETLYYDAMSQCDWTASHYHHHATPHCGHHPPTPGHGDPRHYHPHYHHHYPVHYHEPCCVVTPPAPHAPYCQTPQCAQHAHTPPPSPYYYGTPPSTPKQQRHSYPYGGYPPQRPPFPTPYTGTGARPKSTGMYPGWYAEARPTAKRPSSQRLRDEMGARRGESTASWFQRGMHITAYKTLLTVPKSPGGGSQSSGSEVTELEQSFSSLNTSSEDILSDGTLLEKIPYTRYMEWMSNLPKRLHNVPFSKLTIPGSNVSLAVESDMRMDMNFSKCNLEMADFLSKLPKLAIFDNFRTMMKDIWKAWMSKQALTIHQQLEAGVRYFDLHVTKYRGALYGEHGLFTKQLKSYLKQMVAFLDDHPKEILILHFQTFENLTHKDKRTLVTMLFQQFGAKLSRVCGMSNLTLERLWHARKQVIAILPDGDMDALSNHIFAGVIFSDKIIRSSLPRKQRVGDLINYLDCIYDEVRSDDFLHITQAVVSPDMNMVFGEFPYVSMQEMTLTETTIALKEWIADKEDLNVISVDYAGSHDFIGDIIRLNLDKRAETVV